jgi:DNA-binding NarL/FixJ family response regulator
MDPTEGTVAHRVVIVDDSEDIRLVVRLALERQHDFEVVAEAANGEQALRVIHEHQPDVVLLDIAMPEMDGLQVLRQVRHDTPESIVVMLSGIAETAAVPSAVEHRAHGYIRKGGAVEQFVATLREVVEVQLERRERASTGRGSPTPLD